MNKWLPLTLLLCAFSPIYSTHETSEKVDQEIKEIESTVQPKQFRVLNATPTLNDLADHEVVIVSSNGWVSIMSRDNVEIYAVRMSCVTVIR